MTPEGQGYRITDTTGYTDIGVNAPLYSSSANNGKYINSGNMSEYGFLPQASTGSGTTYYADGLWGYQSSNAVGYLIVGGCAADASTFGGAFAFHVNYAPSYTYWNFGCGLSCEQPATA